MTPHPARAATFALLVCSGCLTLMGGEDKVGTEAATQVEREMGLLPESELTAYVTAIGDRLAKFSKRDVQYRFQIVDTPEANAFALPGGYIYVSRGLLALVNAEDELAGVIGHEIGHVERHHAGTRTTLSAPFAVVTGLAGFATGLLSPSLGRAVSGAGTALSEGLLIAPYSRSQESDADKVGIEIAAQAGWDPAALSRFLETLRREETLQQGQERKQSWFDTHPATEKRVANTQKRASTLERGPGEPIAHDRASLLQRLDGLLLGPDPAAGTTVGDRFVHPDLRFSVRLPKDWKIVNTPSAVGYAAPSKEAMGALQIAGEGDSPEPVIRKLKDELETKLNEEYMTINGLPAARARVAMRTRQGPAVLDITWIALLGQVYQLVGVTSDEHADAYEDTFRDLANTFREIETSERKAIRDVRLRIAHAAAGEQLAELVDRKHSAWSAEEVAVANALDTSSKLERNQLVKIGVEEPYELRSP